MRRAQAILGILALLLGPASFAEKPSCCDRPGCCSEKLCPLPTKANAQKSADKTSMCHDARQKAGRAPQPPCSAKMSCNHAREGLNVDLSPRATLEDAARLRPPAFADAVAAPIVLRAPSGIFPALFHPPRS